MSVQKQQKQQLETLQRWLEMLYERKICKQFDRIVCVVGDEGMGKSTLMVQIAWMWKRIKGETPTSHNVLDRIVWNGRDEFKDMLATSQRRQVIAVMDAARVLHKREAMRGDQIEVEKDLLDVRTHEYLILLGFQDWDDIPSMLQKRRAKNALYLPRRGIIHGFNRDSMDHRNKNGQWPEPDLKDGYPPLDGLPIWDEFQKRDRAQKRARIAASAMGDDDGEEEESKWDKMQKIAEKIKEEGLSDVVGWHGGHNKAVLKTNLIEAKYDLSVREAKTVKDLLENDPGLNIQGAVATEELAG